MSDGEVPIESLPGVDATGRFLLAVALALVAVVVPSDADAEPDAEPGAASIASFFEARFPDIDQNDARLREYGFEPVGSRFVPSYGLRAKFWLADEWRLGAAMAYGFSLSDGDHSAVPTTTSFLRMTFSTERHISHGFAAGIDTGFALIQHTVGSTEQGGALLYAGPMAQPGISWSTSFGSFLVEPSIGYEVHFPIGAAHDNPLWEASFQRSVIHGFVASINLGMKR